jgi:hypothetical protein
LWTEIIANVNSSAHTLKAVIETYLSQSPKLIPDLQPNKLANDVIKDAKKDGPEKEPHMEVHPTQETSATVTP